MNVRNERNTVAVMIDDYTRVVVRCWQINPEGRGRRSTRLPDGAGRRSIHSSTSLQRRATVS